MTIIYGMRTKEAAGWKLGSLVQGTIARGGIPCYVPHSFCPLMSNEHERPLRQGKPLEGHLRSFNILGQNRGKGGGQPRAAEPYFASTSNLMAAMITAWAIRMLSNKGRGKRQESLKQQSFTSSPAPPQWLLHARGALLQAACAPPPLPSVWPLLPLVVPVCLCAQCTPLSRRAPVLAVPPPKHACVPACTANKACMSHICSRAGQIHIFTT
eukprot:scaffold177354_cov15-Tisochrysis_lutea.AAC.1